MACIKGVNRSASAAFAPSEPYLAAGTMAGAVDLSFSSSANLDIFKLDFASDVDSFILSGSIQTSERFNRLSWGKPNGEFQQYSMGIIAGGLVDGNIGLWNPKYLIHSSANENAFIGNLSWHKGPVRGLEFNAQTPNLLASGADEGEICIWDITKPTEPTHFPPLKGSGSATQSEISFLSWNSKVKNILASTSVNGTTAVWDLKKQKPVISFTDSTRRRCSVLQWNPDVVTQLIVASDEDSSPALRLWDMRNIMSPVKEFVGHTKGVIAMAWCPIDSSYLLTCAKDNRTICWDINSGEIVSELPAGTNWNFDVHWYPKIPGVISASSFDGKIGVYNIEGCDRYGVGETDFVTAPLRAPKWYKRKAGVSFGFGGKLVSFHSTEAPTGSSEVYVHNLVTEDDLLSRSSDFEAAIKNGGERSSLRLFCEKKLQEAESEDERETWGFLKVMLEDDGTARTKLLSHLGFSPPPEEKDAQQSDISDQVNAFVGDDVAPATGENGTNKESSVDNGEDFFNNLPSPANTPKANTTFPPAVNNFVADVPGLAAEESQQDENGTEEGADASFDDAVQRALVVGDYKGAVDQCISASRMADALVIAHAGDISLWETTRNQYLKRSNAPYLKVVSAMVNRDFVSLVNVRPLRSWKETLGLLCSFAQPEDWTLLCDTLASRLQASGNTLAATLCYICAGNIDKTVGIWSMELATENGKSYVELLQDLMEKTIVFALASGQKRFSDFLFKLVEKYAEILASQGQLNTAMEYLNLMGTEELSPELMILRERISLATESGVYLKFNLFIFALMYLYAEKDTSTSMSYDNSQYQPVPTHGADQTSYDADTSHHYYPSNLPNSPYGDNYQQQSYGAYGRGYGTSAPGSYQPPSQPNILQPSMFLPSQVPQGNFAPPPVNAQPVVKPFVPANPPMLRNVEQYQQPTLGSQLYPGPGNPSFQAGPPAPSSFGLNTSQVNPPIGQRMPQGIAPIQAPQGFIPVNNAGVPRSGMHPSQPRSPLQSAPVETPETPSAPPPTVQTADTSNVPAHQKPVIATLSRLFHETLEALGGQRANPAKKREIEDNSKKLGALFAKLNSGDISKNAADKLIQLCQALDNADFGTALQIQVQLTTSDWDECNFWLATLKRMIKTRQSLR
ncbi:vesicle coat protein [Lithospermum erythrorhizon]|uniref:Vesicle coat protein n=1 Tax=Lithospermum erythrorhizon TaxID=34254 RepID=A0AAV3NWT6_LITER